MTDSPDSVALESLIDRYSLAEVLEHSAQICRLKGAHIRENWQDALLAGRWRAAAEIVEKAAAHSKVKKVSE